MKSANGGDATMLGTATRISILSLAIGLTVSAWPARADNNTSSLVKASGGENEAAPSGDALRFNTDSSPTSSDSRPPLKFTDPGESPLGTRPPEYAETAPEETPFKTYLGYPKNQLGAYIEPMDLAAKWTFNGSAFNFNSTPVAVGLDYRISFTPMWKLELDYSHFAVSTPSGTVGSYTVSSSSQGFDTYFVKGRYCFLGNVTFYRQLCAGIDMGNDAYPILKFVNSATNLQISEVQDITAGVNLTYQQPFAERYLFQVGIGYNTGTGIGNSGDLTSKSNSSYYARAGLDFNLTEHNTILGEAIYLARTAKLNGLQGSIQQSWETDSSVLGLRLGYMRTF
jgi:hypothetical protein